MKIKMTKNANKNKKPDSFVYKESEEENNKYATRILILFLIMGFVATFLNEMGFFYIEKNLMRVMFFTLLGCVGIACAISFIPKFSSKPQTKYVIIILTSIITMVIMVILNIHAVLTLFIPMAVAMNYHSRKIAILTLVTTMCCAFFAPILGIVFNTWEVDFFITLIYAARPDLINPTLAAMIPDLAYQDITQLQVITDYLSIPQILYATIIGAAVIVINRRKRGQYDSQLDIVKESRDRILVGMADLVENRDLNTGGHINRTSSVVEILTKTLRKEKAYKDILTNEYCEYIVKTAPMHDLGKIAIPDSILNKPERLTSEEFDTYIKKHPQKSYEIVDSILGGLYDKKLLEVAKNVALYHHEKYDGSGYPEGLKGEEIPLEARLMAIADVYDALVSERCYKEAISHEEAYKIIRASMGTHFDPRLWTCFEKSFPKIVDYYS